MNDRVTSYVRGWHRLAWGGGTPMDRAWEGLDPMVFALLTIFLRAPDRAVDVLCRVGAALGLKRTAALGLAVAQLGDWPDMAHRLLDPHQRARCDAALAARRSFPALAHPVDLESVGGEFAVWAILGRYELPEARCAWLGTALGCYARRAAATDETLTLGGAAAGILWVLVTVLCPREPGQPLPPEVVAGLVRVTLGVGCAPERWTEAERIDIGDRALVCQAALAKVGVPVGVEGDYIGLFAAVQAAEARAHRGGAS